jgi:hypothetical protein
MKLHLKGYLLEALARNGAMWDYDLADDAMQALALTGDYWYGTVRLTLADLYSGGLIRESATEVDPGKSGGETKILFQFELTEFGRTRMVQAGLGAELAH